jgi:hypothetical protein
MRDEPRAHSVSVSVSVSVSTERQVALKISWPHVLSSTKARAVHAGGEILAAPAADVAARVAS